MWFAALGSYQHNPWLVHLIHKLLQGCIPVTALLDEPSLSNGREELVSIQSWLYHYDFSSSHSTNSKVGDDGNNPEKTKITENSGDWWVRSGPMREYLPELARDDPSMMEYLKAHGYFLNTCLSASQRCTVLEPGSKYMKICRLVAGIRERIA